MKDIKRIEELEIILENGCDGNCEDCKVKKECKELEKLQNQEYENSFKAGQMYEGNETNIFIKQVAAGMVKFIEGFSPSAIHDMQEIPIENLSQYINAWGFRYTGNY